MLRVVLDANVVGSGWLQVKGPSARILEGIVSRKFWVVLSPAIVAEYRRSLAYAKIRRRLSVAPEVVEAWIDALVLLADVVPGERAVEVVAEDPDDDKYLVAALEGRAELLVSGDHHLLEVGVHEGIRILSPRSFLDVLRGKSGG